MRNAVEFHEVSKKYGEAVVIEGLHLEIPEGQIVVLAGPSGCGKTTTMKMINRLIEPSQGTIVVNGINILRQNHVELRLGGTGCQSRCRQAEGQRRGERLPH